MIELPQLRARVARLEELAGALAREMVVIERAQDVLLYRERRAYLAGVRAAVAGLEDARVALEGVPAGRGRAAGGVTSLA